MKKTVGFTIDRLLSNGEFGKGDSLVRHPEETFCDKVPENLQYSKSGCDAFRCSDRLLNADMSCSVAVNPLEHQMAPGHAPFLRNSSRDVLSMNNLSYLQNYPFYQTLNSVWNKSRDSVPLCPWMIERQNGFSNLTFSGAPTSYLFFHPYRKPKRVRTNFSPSQLLKLERAFDKNHYLVGQERKDLATDLSLTENQVKVWFQNRRTKHKRIKCEDDEQDGGLEEINCCNDNLTFVPDAKPSVSDETENNEIKQLQ